MRAPVCGAALVWLLSGPCQAETVEAPPDDVHVHFRVWTEAAFTAAAPNVISPGGEVEVHGPFWLGRAPFHMLAALSVSQAAGATTFDFTSPDTWGTYAGAKFAVWRPLFGYHKVSDGVVAIAPELRYRFFTSISKHDLPLPRYLRAYGAGVRFTLSDETGDEKATLSAVYGKDERCGDWGYGQWSFDAVVPVVSVTRTGDGGVQKKLLDFAFGAEACLSLGHPDNVRQRDALELRAIAEWGKK